VRALAFCSWRATSWRPVQKANEIPKLLTKSVAMGASERRQSEGTLVKQEIAIRVRQLRRSDQEQKNNLELRAALMRSD
jgi:hypothetical protein